jgi:hypothetical protein
MFAADLLSELNFVLEFIFPKEISDNQEHIKLSVHHVEVPVVEIPVCPIGCKSTHFRTPGEIHCTERYKYIKDVLPLINRWVNSVWSTCNKLHSSNRLLVEAKLYAYNKNDHSLFKKWSLEEFYPLINPNIEFFSDDVVELIFKFENIVDVDDKPMYDISKYIKEYKDRENNCEYCAYYHIQGGRCGLCSSYDWFVQEINLKQYIIKRVTEDSGKDFEESDEAIQLKAKADLRKSVYDDFNKYVEKQKEFLDNELELKRKEWSDLQSEYAYKTAKYISDNIDKALASLDSITNESK